MTPIPQTSTAREGRAALDSGNNNRDFQAGTSSQRSDTREPARARFLGFLTFSGVAAIITYGWLHRSSSIIHADTGLGYYLGIAGGVSMLLLLLYPVRKKIRLLGKLGQVKHWFRIHMILGVAGPVLVLYHCNFQLGSVNSNVALFSMLLVAASGLVGRFIYKHIHNGLYGHKASLAELRRSLQYRKQVLDTSFTLSPTIAQQLLALEQRMLRKRNVFLHILGLPLNAFRMFLARIMINRLVRQDLGQQAGSENWGRETLRLARKQASAMVRDYIRTVQKAADLSAYERLFSLWHFLHMPFFIMLVITGIIHVIAVHMY